MCILIWASHRCDGQKYRRRKERNHNERLHFVINSFLKLLINLLDHFDMLKSNSRILILLSWEKIEVTAFKVLSLTQLCDNFSYLSHVLIDYDFEFSYSCSLAAILFSIILPGFFKGEMGERDDRKKCLHPKLSQQFFTKNARWIQMDEYLSMRPLSWEWCV